MLLSLSLTHTYIEQHKKSGVSWHLIQQILKMTKYTLDGKMSRIFYKQLLHLVGCWPKWYLRFLLVFSFKSMGLWNRDIFLWARDCGWMLSSELLFYNHKRWTVIKQEWFLQFLLPWSMGVIIIALKFNIEWA